MEGETDEVTLELTGSAHGGEAVGRMGDLVTFVSLGLAGEEVRVKVVERKARFQRGRVREVVRESPERVTAPCPLFGTCGGCHWQHASYAEQLRIKTGVLREQLERVGRVRQPSVLEAIASPLEWQYRNRVQVVPVAGTRLVGFRLGQSHEVVPVERCYISDERINEVIARAPWSGMDEREWRGVEEIDIRVAPEQEPLVNVIGTGAGTGTGSGAAQGGRELRYELGGNTFRVPGDAFFQVNVGAAERLVEEAMAWLAPEKGDHVVDAYGGVGTFAVAAAKGAGRVTVMELPGSAVEAVAGNAAANGVENVRAIDAPVERALQRRRERVDLLVLDPPRRGCGPEVVREIVRLSPRRVVYVSCDPGTLARDVKALMEGGYGLIKTRVVDMFPQTYHLESISLLER